jgi:hypothetical protein
MWVPGDNLTGVDWSQVGGRKCRFNPNDSSSIMFKKRGVLDVPITAEGAARTSALGLGVNGTPPFNSGVGVGGTCV